MLFIISIAKALIEVAVLSLLAQWFLALIAGSKRDSNPIYRLFATITRPIHILTRRIAPAFINATQIPVISLLCLVLAWLGLLYAKAHLLDVL
jgi:uncharacterized protein YggT (Ycf19 family)